MNALLRSKPSIITPTLLALFLGVLTAFFNPALAQKPKENLGFEILPQENTDFEMRGNMRVDLQTGFPVAIYSLNYPVAPGNDPVAQARQFLISYAGVLGLEKPDLSDLVLKASRTSLSGTVVRFNQVHQGYTVYGAEVTVNLDKGSRVQFVMSSYKHHLDDSPQQEIISADNARQLAINYLNLSGAIVFDKNAKVIVSFNGETQLCHRIQLQGQEPVGEWEVLVNAATGDFLKVADNAFYCHPHTVLGDADECEPQPLLPLLPPAPVSGTGNTFDADPLSSAAATYGGSYVDGSDANAAVLTAQLMSRTLNQIDLTAGTYSLRGPYAYIVDFEAPNKGLFTQASATFAFDRNADAFEAVNTYYFIDKSMRYLNVTLGVTVMPYQYATGVQYDPSGLSGADNSHYVGGSGRLAFGEGGVDDAEDSDVILHELGHGIHDWITSGGLSNNQGLSEGTGDYWTQSYSRSLGQWTTLQAPYQWVFNWDGHNPFWAGRITNYGAAYPGGLTGAIHTDGQIWSTCMMKIYDAIGRTPTDIVLWEGLNLTNGSATQNDAAVAVQQAAINMGYSSAQLNSIHTLLQGCGYTLPALPLALHTTDFDAERVNDQNVVLSWITETACDVKDYSIERRIGDEAAFIHIATVSGSDNCGTAQFTFEDKNNAALTSWYRIRESGQNGIYEYTMVKAVTGTSVSASGLLIYPQPINGALRFWIRKELKQGAQFTVRILTASGAEVLTKDLSFDYSNPSVILEETETLPSGFYLLEVRTGNEVLSSRFTK